MALALVRSCLMSRLTVGQLRFLQSKPPCHGQANVLRIRGSRAMQFLQNSRRIARVLKPITITPEGDLRFVSSASRISGSFESRNHSSSTSSVSQGIDKCSHFHCHSLSLLIQRSKFSSYAAKLKMNPTATVSELFDKIIDSTHVKRTMPPNAWLWSLTENCQNQDDIYLLSYVFHLLRRFRSCHPGIDDDNFNSSLCQQVAKTCVRVGAIDSVPGFLTKIARPFSAYPSFYSLNPPVIEEIKLGSHVINLEVGSDERNRTSIWCHMNGTTAQSSIMVSHDNHKDNKVLKVQYVERPYGIRLEPLATDKKCEYYNPQRFIWDPRDPTDLDVLYYYNNMTYGGSYLMTEEDPADREYDDDPADREYYYDEAEDREIICSQLLDLSIRPLIPENFNAHVTVSARLLTLNSKHDAGLLATIASSAALMISNITPSGPLGVIRIGRINENIIINPTEDELRTSDIKLLYVCTRGKAIMVHLEAPEISVNDLAIYLKLAHLESLFYALVWFGFVWLRSCGLMAPLHLNSVYSLREVT